MFCQSVTTHLAKEYVKLPSANEAKKIAERFEAKCHLPQIFGAIDGTHIPITAPKTGYRDFVNRKFWASYNVQAVVDDGGLFMNVSCRAPGSAHDSTALKMSALYKRSDNLVPHGFRMLRGTAIPFMLVGDPAYPLLPWIMKGHTGRLSREEESFNVYLSSARNVVEQAFGRLKGRWRILLKRADIYYKFIPTVVIATCALHNFCETHSEGYGASWDQAVAESESVLFPQPSSRPRSWVRSDIRDLLKDLLLLIFHYSRSTQV
nr:protein ANTAGONIST OF LIKE HETEROCHROMATIN PROTEIN 1-like [Rhipicephalus microplus]